MLRGWATQPLFDKVNYFWVIRPPLGQSKLVSSMLSEAQMEQPTFGFISSEAQMEQTSFGSYRPRLRWSKLLLVHIIRGSGQKKEVLVRPVALVGSLNEF